LNGAPMLRRIHCWPGFVLGVPLVVLLLTGSALVYRESIERAAKPVPSTVDPRGRPKLPLDEAIRRVVDQNPGFSETYIQIPPRANAPLEIVLRSEDQTRFLAADPFTGDVLGLLSGGLPLPLEPIRRIHAHWLLGPVGRQFNGFLAVLLGAMALSGLALFLRHPRSWHARIGLIAAIPLLCAALSGALLIWGRVAPASVPQTGAAPALPLEHYAGAALAALPGASFSWISLADPVTVRLRLPSDWQRRGSNDVHLHPATAEPLRIDRFQDAPLSRRFFVAITAIHYGEWGGPLGRFLWAASGVSAAFLWISGLGLYLQRRFLNLSGKS
jgi:uncharacterized iron-regulated membrane protein